jgi:hypothetical protein
VVAKYKKTCDLCIGIGPEGAMYAWTLVSVARDGQVAMKKCEDSDRHCMSDDCT